MTFAPTSPRTPQPHIATRLSAASGLIDFPGMDRSNVIPLAGCLVVDEFNRCLLIHRNTSLRRQWELPGGKIGGAEPILSAGRRQAEEEIGVPLRISNIVGSCQFTSDSVRYTYVWLQATILAGTPRAVVAERHDDCRFFSWDQMRSMSTELSSNLQEMIYQMDRGMLDIRPYLDARSTRIDPDPRTGIPVIAGCVIHDQHGRVLLLHRSRGGRDQWETPGGRVELGETPAECAAREAWEEFGIEVMIGNCFGIKLIEHRGQQMLSTWFEAAILSGTPHLREHGIHDDWAYKDWQGLEGGNEASVSPSVQALIESRKEYLKTTIAIGLTE